MTGKLQLDGTYIDVRVEVKDGILVFSPINDYSQFKDGDVLYIQCKTNEYIFILKNIQESKYIISYLDWNCKCEIYTKEIYLADCNNTLRFATEQEKQKLFDALAKEGKMWDAEKKEIVRWKPQNGEEYYFPALYNTYKFELDTNIWDNDEIDNMIYDRGFVFPLTEDGKAQCQTLCDKLNKAIEGIRL